MTVRDPSTGRGLIQREHFARLLAGLCEMYARECTPALAAIYWNALCSYDADTLEAAIARHVHDAERGRFMPLPADFVAAISGTNTQRAQVALGRVLAGVRKVGRYASVDFGDPLLHAVVMRMGGWDKFCAEVVHGNPAEVEQRFVRLYSGQLVAPDPDAPAYVEGHNARIDRDNGREPAPPVRLALEAPAAPKLRALS